MISIRGIHKRFGSQVVLDGLNLEIEKGEVMGILGPSGTGKSVLLKIIIGLLDPEAGEVLVDGRNLMKCNSIEERFEITQRMGVLFQGAALFDSITLIENVAFPLRQRGAHSEKEIAKRCSELLEQVGLKGYELATPGEVSIGMRKRVGIARALVTRPDILLFDEPNTGLDPQMGQEIYELIKATHDTYAFTGIVVSHEIPEVFQVCSRVAMVYQGVVQQVGSSEEIISSTIPVIQQFVEGRAEGPISMK